MAATIGRHAASRGLRSPCAVLQIKRKGAAMRKESTLVVSAPRPPTPKSTYSSKRLTTTAINILFVVCTSAHFAAAQDIDPSKCFQDMLVTHYDFSQRENLLLSALAIVDEHTFKDSGKNNSLTGSYAGYSLTDKYSEWDKERGDLFEYNKLDISQYKQLLISSTWIGDQGYSVIETCLNTLALSGDGFRYKVEVASPQLVYIQFKWSDPQNGASTVRILNSKIENGNVEDEPPHKLFSPKTPIVFGAAAVPIAIKREKITDDIFITLTTSLNKQPGVIRIRHLPVEKPIIWKRCMVETDPTGKVISHSVTREIRADQWEQVLKPDAGYQFAEEPTCTQNTQYPLENVHILNRNWNQEKNEYTCSGTQNANPRFIDFKWTQGKYEMRCIMGCDLPVGQEVAAQRAQKPTK
jgi:hypothetical protein